MSFLNRIFGAQLFGERQERATLAPLYRAVVAEGRDPFWYRDGGVPDTIDGRFDLVSSVLALVLLRMEAEGPAARRAEVLLTEVFIEDMDGTVRQLGIGDQVVGKHVGKMMGALGGRLGAYRDAGGEPAAFAAAVERNVFRGDAPSPDAVALVAARLTALRGALAAVPYAELLAGRIR
ncbi:MAG TPA: ubiquinol-cytochrome C chaperone family protein [Allosphingosinicella sp.]|jgi:cytochrome b pre-mRNA-processing protein 3